MNRKLTSLLLIGFCLSFMALFVTPTQAHGSTGLKTGDVLPYDVSCVRSQDWTIEGRWYNTTAPAVPHYTNFTESRQRTIEGTITVDVEAVRQTDVGLRITYDLHSYEYYWNRALNDSTPANDYTGSWNQTQYPDGPPIIETITYTSNWNYSDSFEVEIDKIARDFLTMTGYDAAVALSTTFYSTVSAGTDLCSFWIYPDAILGETYSFMHVGILLELIGEYEDFAASGSTAYQIEGSRTYYPPGGGKGLMQPVWVAKYDATIAGLTPAFTPDHPYTIDFKKYVNEFLFDQDTGILLQYHRTYRVSPFFIQFTSSDNTPIDPNNDIWNLEFTMTLQDDSTVWLGLGILEIILICVLVPVGIIVIILIYRWRTHRQ